MRQTKKPRIVIERNRSVSRPFLFCVKWKGCHWKNSQWFTFHEALVAAGVMSVDSLPSSSDFYQQHIVGDQAALKQRETHHEA